MHQHLLVNTRAWHGVAESAFALRRRLASIPSYLGLLQSLWCLHSAFERSVHQHDLSAHGIDVKERKRAHWLAADLQALGAEPEVAPALHPIASAAEAIGCLYVLEGSTLGGQVILPQAVRLLGVSEHRGARFFVGHGERNSRLWTDFLHALNAFNPQSEEGRLIQHGAIGTYAEFASVLRMR